MSHFTRMRTRISDREALVQCLRSMGYELKEGGSVQGWQGRTASVDLVVPMKAGYQIGAARGQDGFYEIVADWWGVKGVNQEEFRRRLETEFEAVQQRIRREYAVRTTMEQLGKQGFRVVQQEELTDGTVKIVARRWRG